MVTDNLAVKNSAQEFQVWVEGETQRSRTMCGSSKSTSMKKAPSIGINVRKFGYTRGQSGTLLPILQCSRSGELGSV